AVFILDLSALPDGKAGLPLVRIMHHLGKTAATKHSKRSRDSPAVFRALGRCLDRIGHAAGVCCRRTQRASRTENPSSSIRKVMTSPLLPQPKQWNVCPSG